MNRAGAIAYSSVPQDEGGKSDQTSIMTRPPGNSRSRLSCQLTAVVISLVVVAAISLAAILPLILKERAVANGRDELLGQPIEDKTTALPEGNIYTEQQQPVFPDSAGYTKNSSLSDGQPSIAQSTTANIEDYVSEKSTVKPAIPTTPTTESTTSTTTTTTTTTTARTTISITPKKTKVPSSTAAKPTAEGKPATSAIPNMEDQGQGTSGETQVVTVGAPKHNTTKEEILNAIYGSSPSKPNSAFDWMNNVMEEHDVPTLVVLAVIVAVAGAAVVGAVAWLVYGRVSSRRRRIGIQRVITDLQSRDKVVLLNSEDSDDD